MHQLALWVFESFHPQGKSLPADRQEKEAAKLRTRLDEDGDGKLDFDEFAQWFTRTIEGIANYRLAAAAKAKVEAEWKRKLAAEKAAKQAEMQAAKAAAEKMQQLADDPAAPVGMMVVLELKGGNDKQRKGAGEGHRRDTIPICNAVIAEGWGCKTVVYSAGDHDAVAAVCAAADGVIVRAAQGEEGVFGAEGPGKLGGLLSELAESGVAVRPLSFSDLSDACRKISCWQNVHLVTSVHISDHLDAVLYR